ncbi:transmembrane protein 272 isoform X2 [Nematostella vectensis]|uniref:transmembrane protein 272 isoform X2 n=1 Tax=Nematostella vectensis TaxID=45351 RepID=UPI00138FBB7B|nr:transmembrane protein 272 isoform X2 [Nematostella vectensis]XP_048589416.1 transmembrane protein 272 isoform X2 [Nematostella vectensis]
MRVSVDGKVYGSQRIHYQEKGSQNNLAGDEEKIWDESPPPPYEADLFGQIKEAKETSDGSLDFCKRVVQLFAGTIGCTVALSLLMALPMAMVIMGAKYKDECPVEPFIPIYLIVGGSFGMLKTIIVLCQRARSHDDDLDMDEDQSMSSKFIDGVLNLFLFTWFIAGNIWVYSKYKPNPIPPVTDPLNYCNPTLYMFAFWVITASYILMGSICFCICCLGVCASCTAFFVTVKD